MKIKVKDYKKLKTEKYLQTTDLFFFVNGINRNSKDSLITKQELKNTGLNCVKILNRATIKTLDTSIYNKIKPVIKSSMFFLKLQQNKPFLKNLMLNTFNHLFFELLIIKFNTKIYSINSLKNNSSLKYKETKLLFYQFSTTHLKICYKVSK